MSDIATQKELFRLAGRVDDLTADLARVERDVQDLGASATVLCDGRNGAACAVTLSDQIYDSVEEWVAGYYLPTFVRPVGGEIRWCSEWGSHAEAVVRFEAMWRSWEVLRQEGGLGMSSWLIHHLDPNVAGLLCRTGPFAQCTPDRHFQAEPAVSL